VTLLAAFEQPSHFDMGALADIAFGSLPCEPASRSVELFATEVMPAFRSRRGLPRQAQNSRNAKT
jgi:hypothetical protein